MQRFYQPLVRFDVIPTRRYAELMKNLTTILVLLLVGVFGFAIGCKKTETKQPATGTNDVPEAKQLTDQQKSIKGITDSETLIQALSGRKSQLAAAFKSTEIDPSDFAEAKINYTGLAKGELKDLVANAESEHSDPLASYFYWPLSNAELTVGFADVWKPLLTGGRFEDAQFGVIKGTFLDSGEFEMETKFEGRIRDASNSLIGVSGYQILGWKQVAPDDWKIATWKQTKLKVLSVDKPIFEDVTNSAFPDDETRKRIETATHANLIVERCGQMDLVRSVENGKVVETQSIKEARAEFKGCNDWGSVGQYPSVSTVDFDSDGDDDLFITDRMQSPQLLCNNGDGTFDDVTTSSGIDETDMVTCGYFFDYDNDGDADLLLGKSMVASRFYDNDGGKFIPNESINQVLEDSRFVNAVSIADLNGDGLLDIYMSTYATGTGPIDDWLKFITRAKDRVKTRMKIERADKFVDRGGPPNILLMNRGGTFDWVKITDELKQYRNSYQSSWTDYDDDGDLDLYICNDFAPDVFLRNDTPRGSFEPKFADVTQEVVPTMDMGFGMGCTWGDYDNDGDLDLYVSNMYSKAGNRIVDQIEGADPRLKVAAHGNFLFENVGKKFKQIAGDADDQQHVSRVGWSYGGQFADFDNDGGLDIYVPSGCYSAPQEVETKVDL